MKLNKFCKFSKRLIFVLILLTSSNIFSQKGGRWKFENNGNDEATWDLVDNNGILSGAALYSNVVPNIQGDYYLSIEDSANYGVFTTEDQDELDFLQAGAVQQL